MDHNSALQIFYFHFLLPQWQIHYLIISLLNEVFYNTLIDAGLDVVFFADFHDHSLLEEKTINGILTQGKNKGASLFITTEKDFVKLPSEYQPLFGYIKMDIELNNKDGLFKDIEKLTSI